MKNAVRLYEGAEERLWSKTYEETMVRRGALFGLMEKSSIQ
jgi:hypothetical protein